jgi:hypothetical protein
MRDRIEPVFAQSIQHVRLMLLPPSPPLSLQGREKRPSNSIFCGAKILMAVVSLSITLSMARSLHMQAGAIFLTFPDQQRR